MLDTISAAEAKAMVRRMAETCAKYKGAVTSRALWQLVTTLVPLLLLLALMLAIADRAYWLTLILAVPAGGLVVRLFIIQHDCGHQSFLPTRRANDFVGRCMSLFTLTPYGLWRREHAIHHANSGNLDRRGVGDIDTLTVSEYRALGPLRRLGYRIYRHPLFLFGVGIPLYFLVLQRLPWFHGLPARDSWKSVLALDAALVVVFGALSLVVDPLHLAMVGVPVVIMASAAGGWLFFVQHQFEGTYWARNGSWDFQTAAVLGSSYYELPALLNWFTGNIGLHHIHHLNGTIPNYRLQECAAAIPECRSINRIRLLESLSCVRLTLWDEAQSRLVGFADAAAPA